jgi:IS30 family transposase
MVALYKSEPPKISRDLLAMGIAYRRQEIEHGGLGKATLRKLLTLATTLRDLRLGRALRVPRERTRNRNKPFIGDAIMISDRPPEIADRAVPGHWEGDLILGLESSAIGTLVERSSRFTMLLHLPRMDGYQRGQRIKNGPPLAGHGAEAVREAIVQSMGELPEQLRQSLTWDQGAEMAQHVRLSIDAGCRSTSEALRNAPCLAFADQLCGTIGKHDNPGMATKRCLREVCAI